MISDRAGPTTAYRHGLPATSRLLLDIASSWAVPANSEISESGLAAASRHGLLGLMALSDHQQLAEAALAPYTRLAARQRAMEHTMKDLLVALAESDVPATVVKGPAVARWAYRDFRLRTFTDVDLLVPSRRIDDALTVLEANPHTLGIPPKTPKADKRNIPLADESGVHFTLDLHWDLFSYTQLRGCADGATAEGWDAATWDPGHELGPMWQLPQSTLIAFLAAHSILDHRFRLILFRDLAEAARPERAIDWQGLLEFVGRHDLRSTTYIAWLLAAAWLGAQVPADVLSELRPRSLPIRAAEMLSRRIDPVTFDGHKPHPLNLAMVLLHDRRSTRTQLALAAPAAFPEWLRRVEPATTRPRPRRVRKPSARPRVLHLLPVDIARGAQTYARAMREALDGPETEHRTMTIFQSDPKALDADFDLDVPAGLGRRVGFSPLAHYRLWRFCRTWKPDVVIAHGGEALKYAALLVPAPGGLVYYKIGTSGDLLENPFRRQFHRYLANRAEVVAGVSNEMVEEVVELIGDPNVAVTCIPNGRDPSDFSVRQDRGRAEPVRIISVGHLGPLKRPEWFVDAITTLRERGVDCEGWWVGDGPLFDQMRSRSSEGLTFLGNRDDVADLLSQSDLFLLSSVGEGMPGVLIEAGMSSLPSVTTAVAGAGTVVSDGTTGIVVGVEDEQGFIAAAEKLARDPELRRAMGEAARRRCSESFTLKVSAEKWEDLLEPLIADRRR